eukprot:scaffold66497_cov95-Phaeocystis_antarctica.AAC.1
MACAWRRHGAGTAQARRRHGAGTAQARRKQGTGTAQARHRPAMSFSRGFPAQTATLNTTKMSSRVPINSRRKPPAVRIRVRVKMSTCTCGRGVEWTRCSDGRERDVITRLRA